MWAVTHPWSRYMVVFSPIHFMPLPVQFQLHNWVQKLTLHCQCCVCVTKHSKTAPYVRCASGHLTKMHCGVYNLFEWGGGVSNFRKLETLWKSDIWLLRQREHFSAHRYPWKTNGSHLSFYHRFLPPTSVVEVIESEPSFRLCVSTNTLTAKPFDLQPWWRQITNFGAKGLANVRSGRCVNAQAFSFFLHRSIRHSRNQLALEKMLHFKGMTGKPSVRSVLTWVIKYLWL